MSRSKVLICGDTHQNIDIGKLKRLYRECRGGSIELTKNDYVIVCGDFGLLWNNSYLTDYYDKTVTCVESNLDDMNWDSEELELLDWYENCPWTTLFVDG